MKDTKSTAYYLDNQNRLKSILRVSLDELARRADLLDAKAVDDPPDGKGKDVVWDWETESWLLQAQPIERATWNDIKEWREKHKRAPVETSQGVFDADEAAEENFRGMIDHFDAVPTKDSQGRLEWKRADNTKVALTKGQLQTVFAELKKNRAIRGAILHARAEEFNAMNPMPPKAALRDLSYWTS